jgi:hypothetical protein
VIHGEWHSRNLTGFEPTFCKAVQGKEPEALTRIDLCGSSERTEYVPPVAILFFKVTSNEEGSARVILGELNLEKRDLFEDPGEMIVLVHGKDCTETPQYLNHSR